MLPAIQGFGLNVFIHEVFSEIGLSRPGLWVSGSRQGGWNTLTPQLTLMTPMGFQVLLY